MKTLNPFGSCKRAQDESHNLFKGKIEEYHESLIRSKETLAKRCHINPFGASKVERSFYGYSC